MSKNIIVGGTEFVTGGAWSEYVLKMHNITCRCDDHIRCLKNIINELVDKQGDIFNIYQKRLSGAITYTPAPAHDTGALVAKIRELKGTAPVEVKPPETCTEPIHLTNYLNYVNELHNEIIKRCSAIIEHPEKWRNENAIIDNIFNFQPAPNSDNTKTAESSQESPPPQESPPEHLHCKNCLPSASNTVIQTPSSKILYESLDEVPTAILDIDYLRTLQHASESVMLLYRDSKIVVNDSRYANLVVMPLNNYFAITTRNLCDEYFNYYTGIWNVCSVNDVVILIKSISGRSYNTVEIGKTITKWLEINNVPGRIGVYNLKKYLELLKSEGFIVHHSDFKANEEIILNLRQRLTKADLINEFNRYLNYSEYDIINMDWSDYDKKIYPLIKNKYEFAYSAKIDGRKIIISHVFKEHGSSSEVITPAIMDFITGHTHPMYRYEGMDIEPPSVDDIEWFISGNEHKNKNYNNNCVFNMVSAAEGAYIMSVARRSRPVLDHKSYFEQANKISGRYTFEGAISKLKRIYANFDIILYFRPTPGFDMGKNTHTAASLLKLSDDVVDTLITNFKNVKKTDFAKMDLSEFDIEQNISDYEFILYPTKLIKNKLSPAPFTHYQFSEDFNSITADIMPIRLPLTLGCIAFYFKELPSIISFDSLKIIDSTYAVYTSVKYYLFLSKKQLSVVYRQNDTFELYGPINR